MNYIDYGLIDNKKIKNIFKDEINDFKLNHTKSSLAVKTIFYKDYENRLNDEMLITVFINNEILFERLYLTLYEGNFIKELIKLSYISIEFEKDEITVYK